MLPPEPPGGPDPVSGALDASEGCAPALADGPGRAEVTSGVGDGTPTEGRAGSSGPSDGSGSEPGRPGVGSDGRDADGLGSATPGVVSGAGVRVGVGGGVAAGVGGGAEAFESA